MSLSKGILISVWNGLVNFAKAKKAGFVFALVRLGYGSFGCQIDEGYERNCDKAKAAGLKVGVYWRSYATTIRSARVEAAGCLEILNNMTEREFDLPIYIEADSPDIAKAFCAELQAAGYNAATFTRGEPVIVDGVSVGSTEVKIKSKKTSAKQPADVAASNEKA